MPEWRSSHQDREKQLADKMAGSIINLPDMSEDEKDEILFSILALNDEKSISKEDIRKVLYETPQRANLFLGSLLRGSYQIKSAIARYTEEIKS